jgi:hypothetical protein
MIPNFAAYRLGWAETNLLVGRGNINDAAGNYASCLRDAMKQCPEVARASLETVRAWPATWALLPDDVRGAV